MKLEIRNVTKKYNAFTALEDINLTIKQGRIVGLLGSNGSGKTTLIKLINGLLSPTEGEILIDDLHPGVESKKKVSYLPERNYLDINMRVIEVINYFKDFYDNFDEDKSLELLNKLNIDKNAKISTLSKGTKEKVELILVMSRKADLYILDEPIGGVDPAARDYILDTILSNLNKGSSVIISTHLIADIEKILDDVIFISNGKIVLFEETDKLRAKENKSIDAIFRGEFKC